MKMKRLDLRVTNWLSFHCPRVSQIAETFVILTAFELYWLRNRRRQERKRKIKWKAVPKKGKFKEKISYKTGCSNPGSGI
jgi:hypothetical protein